MTIIYLDMDGVLCDLVGGIADLLNYDKHALRFNWPRGEYDLSLGFGVPSNYIWSALEKNPAIWEQLEPLPWMNILLARCRQMARTLICTSPTLDPACAAGKIRWLQNQFGKGFRDYVIVPHKQLLATPQALLIDDCEKNVASFQAFGGMGMLFPALWNKLWEFADDPMQVLPAPAVEEYVS